jgi:DNA-directed RNA polymerase specialized sigma24 family protein
VVERNIASGRFTIAPSYYGSPSDDDDLLPSYAEQVLVELLTESERLARLIEGDPASWRAVIERMERMAYFWLGPHGREEWAAWEARDATAHTCADLWIWLQTHPYPFDVPFDRWSARALNNRLHESRRKQQVRERWGEESLDLSAFRPDTVTTVGDRLADMSFDEWLERTANREALLQALALLKERMATVLRLWYLEQ